MLRRREDGRGSAGKLIARAVELSWVIDYRGEIESDFSVLHRVDSLEAIDGPRFYRLAEQLAYYDGALRGRLRSEMSEQQRSAQSVPSSNGASLPDISEFVGVSGPNSQGQPWIEYRGG